MVKSSSYHGHRLSRIKGFFARAAEFWASRHHLIHGGGRIVQQLGLCLSSDTTWVSLSVIIGWLGKSCGWTKCKSYGRSDPPYNHLQGCVFWLRLGALGYRKQQERPKGKPKSSLGPPWIRGFPLPQDKASRTLAFALMFHKAASSARVADTARRWGWIAMKLP